MSEFTEGLQRAIPRFATWRNAALAGLAAAALWAPGQALATVHFIVASMIAVSPLVVPGMLLSAWVTASGAGAHVARVFEGNRVVSVVAASALGTAIPVCGITVLPLMTGLLASGVPLAPVMAFWLSSPITGPTIFAVTLATLGTGFAVGKMLAAFGLGLLGGAATAAFASRPWARAPLREGGFAAGLGGGCCGPSGEFRLAFWKEAPRRAAFGRDLVSMIRLLVVVLGLAFAAEHLMNSVLPPEALAPWLGGGTGWAVPLAVFVGAPAYVDGYAALPLTRGLIEHGMSEGAAMAFLVSGGVVSIWGAMAILPVLKIRPFLLYLAVALAGSLAAGWAYDLAV